jgi:hypothetical protein
MLGFMTAAEQTWDQRILARLKPSVDPSLIAESLRLTPTERLARLQKMLAFVEAARSSSDALPRTARNADQR